MCTTQVLEQVSGSADHRKEYDNLKTAKHQAQAASVRAYQKKKRLAAQRRQVRDQKDEATRMRNCETSPCGRRDDAVSVSQLRDDRRTGRKLKLNSTARSRNVWVPLRGLPKRVKPGRFHEALRQSVPRALEKTPSLRGGVA